MKRSELVVGAELYYARERDWATPEYGSGRGDRVKVLAVEPWEEKRASYDRRLPEDERFRAVAKGSGVLVERTFPASGAAYRDVVPIAHLKGGYDAVKAEVEAWCKRRDDAKATAEETRLRRHSRATVAAASVNVRLVDVRYNGRNVSVDLATFEAMAAALAGQGWRYQP